MPQRQLEDPDLAQVKLALGEAVDALGRYIARQVEATRAPRAPAVTPPPSWDDDQPRPLAYSVRSAAEALGVSTGTIWRLIKEGQVRTFKLGARTLIGVEELDRLIRGG